MIPTQCVLLVLRFSDKNRPLYIISSTTRKKQQRMVHVTASPRFIHRINTVKCEYGYNLHHYVDYNWNRPIVVEGACIGPNPFKLTVVNHK